jgi:hypothetical protein
LFTTFRPGRDGNIAVTLPPQVKIVASFLRGSAVTRDVQYVMSVGLIVVAAVVVVAIFMLFRVPLSL